MLSSVVRNIACFVIITSLVMAHIQRLNMVDRLVLFTIVVCSLVKTLILIIMMRAFLMVWCLMVRGIKQRDLIVR